MTRTKEWTGSEWKPVDQTGLTPDITQAQVLSKLPTVQDIDEFREVSSFPVAATGGTQGVAVDGTHVYISNGSMLYKYTYAGALVTSRNVSGDGTSTGHTGGISVKDGVIYAVTNNYPTKPVVNHVAKWNTSNLSYIGEHSTPVSDYNADLAYHNGLWWICYYDGTVRSYNNSFVQQAVYNLPFNFDTGTFHFDGLDWIGNNLYLNPHSGMIPQSVQQFFFDGTEFTHTKTIAKPLDCTQGISYDTTSKNMYFIKRLSGANAVVVAKPAPSDLRDKQVGWSGVGSSHSTTSKSYVEDTAIMASIFVRRGDLVLTDLSGIYITGSGGVKAYVEPASSTGVPLTLMTTPGSIRTSNTDSNGQTLSYGRVFRAESDGVARFSHYWASTTGSSVTSLSASIVARIVGREL